MCSNYCDSSKHTVCSNYCDSSKHHQCKSFFFFTVLFFSFQGGRKVEYPTDPKVTSGERERERECVLGSQGVGEREIVYYSLKVYIANVTSP